MFEKKIKKFNHKVFFGYDGTNFLELCETIEELLDENLDLKPGDTIVIDFSCEVHS